MANFPCGTRVLDPCDPRHVGVVVALNYDLTIRVRWIETGWYSDVPADSLVRAEAAQMNTAKVRDPRERRSGSIDSFPLVAVKVGDWVGFKSDREQSGRIVKIEGDRLHLHNENGFGGSYLRYAKDTVEFAEDCWIKNPPMKARAHEAGFPIGTRVINRRDEHGTVTKRQFWAPSGSITPVIYDGEFDVWNTPTINLRLAGRGE
jgi:hypothetical protein